MRREWELEDLIECWTLDEAEFGLLGLPVVSSVKTTDYLVTALRGRSLAKGLTWQLTCTDTAKRCFFTGNYREAL
jgi:hypothetical protein